VRTVLECLFRDGASPQDRLDSLESENLTQQIEIQRLIAKGDDSAVKFSGLGLKSLEETHAWVELQSQDVDLDFSLIPDAYIIFELLTGEEVDANQSQMLQSMNNLKSLAWILSIKRRHFRLSSWKFLDCSMEPRMWAGMVARGNRSSRIYRHVDKWNLGPSSMRKLIDRKLPGIRASFRSVIGNNLRLNSRLYGLAIESLERSISWIINLCSWIDRAYENANTVSRMSKSKSWALITQLVRRVFAELFVMRMGTVRAMVARDRKAMCSGVLWSVFRTLNKMNKFDEANFEDHPAIASEHIKFLACNSGFDMLEALEKDVSGLKSEAKEADHKVAAAVKKADAASNLADANKKSIFDLGKRVDKKSDK
jgi:hypothetical protein